MTNLGGSRHLAECEPRFFVAPWIGMAPATTPEEMLRQRAEMGVHFRCGCGCGQQVHVAFINPLDGGTPADQPFLFARVSLVDDHWTGWDSLNIETFDLGTHGRWLINRGWLTPAAP